MKVPRMSRVERRQLIRLGRRSDDPYTALRFQAVARLGTGSSTPRVAAELDIATSTVVSAADRFLADGVDGLYDRRRGNGERKADERFDQVLSRACPDRRPCRPPPWRTLSNSGRSVAAHEGGRALWKIDRQVASATAPTH